MQLMDMMGSPRDGCVYHYSFNHSRLVDVRSTCGICNPTEVAIPAIKSLASMNFQALMAQVSSFLMSTRNTTRNIKKEPLFEENSTLLEVRVEC